jgi:Fe-S oxidoreductase
VHDDRWRDGRRSEEEAVFIREKCDLCGDCLVLCPYVDYDREEAVRQFESLIEGGTPEILKECFTCVACNQFCEKGARPFDLILERHEETGILNIPEQNAELFRNLPNSPSRIIEGDPGKPALSLCSVGDLIPGLFEGPIFEGLTLLKGGDYFCNVGWVHLGAETPVREGARRVVENIAKIGVEEVIFYHDDCYALMATLAPEYGIEVPFRPVHIIEYLLDWVRKNRKHIKPLGLKVAYQQPCASRYTPWKDEQLDELLQLIGAARVEREYDRRFALCCGSPMMPRDREKAMRIKKRNIDDAVSHGAEAMAYLCPLCVLNLRKPADAAGLRNHHLIELVKTAVS